MNEALSTRLQILRYVWNFIWSKNNFVNRMLLLISIFLILVTIVLNLSVPFLLKQIISALSGKADFIELQPLVLIVGYGSLWGLAQVVSKIREMVSLPPTAAGSNNFSLALLKHLHSLSFRFHQDRKMGNILSAFNSVGIAYPELIRNLFLFTIPLLIEISLAILLLGYFLDVRFGIALLVMLLFYGILSYFSSDMIVRYRKRKNECEMSANSFIVDSLLNAETVKTFDTQNYEVKNALTLLRAREDADVAILMNDAKIHLVQNAIIGITIILMTLLSGLEVIKHEMNVSDFVLINGYLIMFMTPLSMLGYIIRQTRDNFARLDMALKILEEPIEIKERANAKPLIVHNAEIRFEKVSFKYDDRTILQDISFDVPAGKTVAIVGSTGSGKSTLSRLLFRLYDVTQGRILIDGQNIAEVTEASLRQSIGIVPQDSILFNDTIYNNITYGDPNCSRQEVLSAMKNSQIESFIDKLPEKLNTIVGERGLKLSGGEKQRVAIARMLVKNPKIYIFDEATSALDVNTEREVQKHIELISKDITTIIIAHRLSTIVHADTILVLSHGKIMEKGNHTELIELNGLYAALWKLQIERYKEQTV